MVERPFVSAFARKAEFATVTRGSVACTRRIEKGETMKLHLNILARPYNMVFLVIGWVLFALPIRAGEKSGDFNEQGLRQLGLPSDNANLLAYIRNAVDIHTDLKIPTRLISLLGSNDFNERESGCGQLVALGPVSLPVLRKHFEDADLEVVRRSKECVEQIEKRSQINVPLLAARLLVNRRAKGTVEALLRFLPWADPYTEEEIYYGLEAVAVAKGNIDPLLVAALEDGRPERRAVAACIIGRLGTVSQRKVVCKLLQDVDTRVQLRTAQGLLAGGDKTGLPTLIGLINDASVEICWQAEELLRWVADDRAPPEICGSATEAERKQCHVAWTRWWLKHWDHVELPDLESNPRRPGLVLLWEADKEAIRSPPPIYRQRMTVFGGNGIRRYEIPLQSETNCYPRLEMMNSLSLLSGKYLLRVKEISGSEKAGCELTKFGLTGVKIAEYHKLEHVQPDCAVELATGNLQLASAFGYAVFNKAGRTPKEVLYAKPEFPIHHRTYPNSRFSDDGRLFCLEEYEENGRWFIALSELDPVTNTRIKDIYREKQSTDRGGSGSSWFEPCRDGLMMGILRQNEKKMWVEISQVNFNGQMISKSNNADAICCERLRNGNTLTVNSNYFSRTIMAAEERVVEMDHAGRAVWEAYSNAKILGARVVFPLVRFGFQRPDHPKMDIDAAPHRIRAMKSSDRLVRSCSAERLAQLPPTQEVGEAALAAIADPDPTNRRHMVSTVAAARKFLPAALPALIHALTDSNVHVRQEAVRAVRAVGFEAVPSLLQVAQDKRRSIDDRAIALGLLAGQVSGKDYRLIPLIRERFHAGTHEERYQIAGGLVNDPAGAELFIPDLLQELQQPAIEVQIRISQTLGYLGPRGKNAVAGLQQALMDPRTRMFAAEALSQICPTDEAIAGTIAACLQEKLTMSEKEWIIRSLGKFKNRAKCAVPALIKALDDVITLPSGAKDYTILLEAALTLGFIGPDAKEAVKKLIFIAKNEEVSYVERQRLYRVITWIDPESAKLIDMSK
jgi:HEAT repeat protein